MNSFSTVQFETFYLNTTRIPLVRTCVACGTVLLYLLSFELRRECKVKVFFCASTETTTVKEASQAYRKKLR
jgi:hypothetical protein